MTKTTLTEILASNGHKSTSEQLLTVREVADHLRVDGTTVRRWIKTGALEAAILPHAGHRKIYRVKKSTMDRLTKGGRA